MSSKKQMPLWAIPAIIAGSCLALLVVTWIASGVFFTKPIANVKESSEEVAGEFIHALYQDRTRAKSLMSIGADPKFNYTEFGDALTKHTGPLVSVDVHKTWVSPEKSPTIIVSMKVIGEKKEALITVLLANPDDDPGVKSAAFSG